MISSNFFLRRFDFIKMLTNYKVNKLVVTYCLSHRISISWSNLLLESRLYLMPQLHDKFMICQTFFVINKAETRIFAKEKVGWNHLKYHHLSLNYALYVFLSINQKNLSTLFHTLIVQIILQTFIIWSIVIPSIQLYIRIFYRCLHYEFSHT